MTLICRIYKDKYMPKEEKDDGRKGRGRDKDKDDKKEKKPRDKSRTRTIFGGRKKSNAFDRPPPPPAM